MELDSEAHINEVILYKAEVELKETSSTRKKAIEHLRKSLFKKAQSKGESVFRGYGRLCANSPQPNPTLDI